MNKDVINLKISLISKAEWNIFAELLKNAGYEKEAKYALEHIEHEKQKPFLKIKVVHSGIEHLEEEFKNDVDYYGYRKTANLIEECKNLLR